MKNLQLLEIKLKLHVESKIFKHLTRKHTKNQQKYTKEVFNSHKLLDEVKVMVSSTMRVDEEKIFGI